MKINKNKRGDIEKTILVQVILIALVFVMFLLSTAGKIENRGVRQDIIEAQTAMLIGSAIPGMSFEISKINFNGIVDSVRVDGGKIFISIDYLGTYGQGKRYFTPYDVTVLGEKDKFVVKIS